MNKSGKFVILVKPPRKKVFGELSTYDFDNNVRDKSMRRENVLERVASSVSGWASRYANFRDAGFQVRELTPRDDGKYGKGKGTLIEVFRELDNAKQARLAFNLHVAAQRREEEEAAARKRAKQRGETAPAKPKAAKAGKATVQPGEAGTSRRDIRRAAKKVCRKAEGTTQNWRNYLS